MQTILEQQKQLLDLRSSVEKSDAITSGIKDQLDKYDRDIEDLKRRAETALYEAKRGGRSRLQAEPGLEA